MRFTVVRFALVGVTNTVSYFLIFLPLVRVSPYLAAHAAGLLASMTVAFFLHTHVTFKVRPTWRRASLFPLATVANATAHSMALVFAVETFGVGVTTASACAAAFALPITFLATRLALVDFAERI